MARSTNTKTLKLYFVDQENHLFGNKQTTTTYHPGQFKAVRLREVNHCTSVVPCIKDQWSLAKYTRLANALSSALAGMNTSTLSMKYCVKASDVDGVIYQICGQLD